MPLPTTRRAVIVVVVCGALAGGYRWWSSPERQIRRLLDQLASSLSHDAGQPEVGALAAVASLQSRLAPDVVVRIEPSPNEVRGRQEVTAVVARLRASSPAVRVQFFDPVIAVTDPSATTDVTAQLTLRDASGADLADAYHVSMTLRRVEGSWMIASARVRPEGGATP